jgi:pyruvate dehydrogenase E2 component (dihydrolipoamide acetyltransferase)
LGEGRITASDLLELIQRRGGEQIQRMSRREKLVAERMTESFRDVPQFSLRFTAAMDHALLLLPRPGQAPASGAGITINALILRAVAIALSRFPGVQFQFRPDGIIKPSGINLGFAVALGRELVVPVIRDADKKGILRISAEAADLISRARSRTLRLEEVTGGTFTVSNLGMFGISSFVPIINPGEAAILGVGAIRSEPVARGGSLAVEQVVELTLVADHRSVNGAEGAEFCRTLTRVLEGEDTPW